MIQNTTRFTNLKLEEKKLSLITENDMRKFLGLVILAGTMNSNMENASWMWHPEYGRSIFPKTMSLWKFKKITANIRFDNFSERSKRSAIHDKLAPIRDIFDDFIRNSQKLMNPRESVTVDVRVVPFRGR